MKIVVKIKPNSKENSVTRLGENEFSVRVKAPAKEGRANEAVVKLLSAYFRIPKTSIVIVRGLASKNKLIALPKITII